MPDTYMIAGSTSGVGTYVARKLLERGEMVRALVRDEQKVRDLFGSPPNLHVVVGEVSDHDAAFEAADGAHFIVSTLGARFPDGEPEDVDYGGVRTIVDAATAHGSISHFVLVSSIGASHEEHDLNARFKDILKWKLAGENYLRSSGLPYAIVRPGGLNDELGGMKAIRVDQGDTLHGAISRETVAEICLFACMSKGLSRELTFEVVEAEDGEPPNDWLTILNGLKPD